MGELPSGTVTFLFTDIEGSTKLWQTVPDAIGTAIARHDVLLRQAVAAHGGVVFKTVGDAICAAFPAAPQALAAALAAQRALATEVWPLPSPLRVRMALHSGEAEARGGDYVGQPLNRVARLLSAGHGGQVLLSQTALELARGHLPPGAFPWDLGTHRLKDLLEPERIWQLVHPELPDDFPPLVTLDARPHNLPLQPTPFLGREQEVAEVVGRLRDPNVRLLTLTGPGGTGKTRLGLQAAAEAVETFPDGVWFVPLAPVRDPALVPAAVAEVLGVREEGARPLAEVVAGFLHEKRLLLVLDNVEHLLPAAASAVGALLAAAPGLTVLATSRAPLRLRAEHEQPVPPLPLPRRRPPPTAEQLGLYEAVRLFVARAVAVQPSFAVTNANAPAVAEICHRLDGLPLAIELAAARVRLLPPPALLVRLEQRLPLLTGGALDAPARQQTLREAMAWSYDLLTPDEQKLFRRLSVFVGGFDLDAAEVVVGSPRSGELGLDVLDGVKRLARHSLLRQEAGRGDQPRFGMLGIIREYGLEQLEASGEADEARQRHAAFFLILAEHAAPALNGPEQPRWLERLDADHDDFRAALAWALEREPETALRLAGALYYFWSVRGYLSEGRGWLERVLTAAPAAAPSFRSLALRGSANLAFAQGAYAEARDLADAAVELARETGDDLILSRALNSAATAAMGLRELARSEALLTEALGLFQRLGDAFGEAQALSNLGVAHQERGDLETAKAYYEQALGIDRRIGTGNQIVITLVNLGAVERQRRNTSAAGRHYREALTTAQAVQNRGGIAYAIAGLAGLVGEAGDPVGAGRLLGAAEALLVTIGAVLEHAERAMADADTTAARTALGEDPFVAAWAAGRALPLEEAIVEALALAGELAAEAADA